MGSRSGEQQNRSLGIVVPILGQVHGGHATLAELALQAVATAQGGGEAVQTYRRYPGLAARWVVGF